MKHGFAALLVLSFLLVLGIFLAGCTSTPNTPGTHPPSMDQTPPATPFPSSNVSAASVSEAGVVTSNNQFARDLYLQLARNPQYAGSNIFSRRFPYRLPLHSLTKVPAVTTADEIRSVFHFPSDKIMLREGFFNVNAGINNGDTNYTLNTANALWAERTFPFLPDYISPAGHWYSANVTNLDFIGHPEESRLIINTWVENRTNDKILDLLPAGSIEPLTRLVITNAVYFKGTWVKQFDANDTQDADFHISPQNTVTVKMMQRTDEAAIYPYAETADLQVLSMPYAHGNGSGLSMIILLPKNDSLESAEAALDPRNLSVLEQNISSQRVMVYFPKFKLETQYKLPGTLAAMGMPTAFTGTLISQGWTASRTCISAMWSTRHL